MRDGPLEFDAVQLIASTTYSSEGGDSAAPRGGGTAPPPQGSADERGYGMLTVVASPLLLTVNVPVAVSAV